MSFGGCLPILFVEVEEVARLATERIRHEQSSGVIITVDKIDKIYHKQKARLSRLFLLWNAQRFRALGGTFDFSDRGGVNLWPNAKNSTLANLTRNP